VVALKDAEDDWKEYPGLPALPEDHDEWESRLVPKSDLALRHDTRGYAGFHLSFDIADIADGLRPVQAEVPQPGTGASALAALDDSRSDPRYRRGDESPRKAFA
jgi:hypothetical protein